MDDFVTLNADRGDRVKKSHCIGHAAAATPKGILRFVMQALLRRFLPVLLTIRAFKCGANSYGLFDRLLL
jgi:uncharacterized protein (DUF1778 family)